MNEHPHVTHPLAVVEADRAHRRRHHPWLHRNTVFLEWMTDHVLASVMMFDLALVLPMLVLPAPQWVKLTLIIVSSNWIQWWALPALQCSSNRIQHRQEVKADTDHQTLTYLAKIQDEQLEILRRLDSLRPDQKA